MADDPHTVNVEKIKDIQIVRTVVVDRRCTRLRVRSSVRTPFVANTSDSTPHRFATRLSPGGADEVSKTIGWLPGARLFRALAVHQHRLLQLLVDPVTLLADLGMTLPRGFGQFDLKLESNFATWYSSALLLLAGGAALLISVSPAPATVPLTRYRAAWTMTSLVFFALSVDEMIELHERIGFWFTERFGTIPGLLKAATPSSAGLWRCCPSSRCSSPR